MKPNFALNITDTAISLLHRTSRGWLEVGQTAFDTPDLEEALGYLRSSALGLSPHGITTKLVLPASQVLYMEVEAPGPDKAAREGQIRAALEGRTPYAVDDLVFDWWGTGSTVQVAVVARETLDEAEGFAEAHRFNPVSFVSLPPERQFAGEPWFGTTTQFADHVAEGEKVTRDQDPIKIITRETSKPAAEKPAKEKPAAEKPETSTPEAVAEDNDVTEAAKAEAAQEAQRAAQAKREAIDAERAVAEAAEKAEALAREQKERAEKEIADKERAERAEAKRIADEAEAKRLAEDTEATRKIEAAKAEMEARAQELARAEAKRLVEEAEKAKADAAAREAKDRSKAALLEAERQRANSEIGAEEEARAAFSGVSSPEIADPVAPPAAPAFSSRRNEERASAPSVGPATAKPVQTPAASGQSAQKSGGPAAPKITSISSAKAAPPTAPAPKAQASAAKAPPVAPLDKGAAKPLNGTAAFATGARPAVAGTAKGTAKGTVKGTAQQGAPVVSERIPGKATALSRFKSKVSAAAVPKATPKAAIAEEAADGAATMGKFGAKMASQRGKPRYLGLILTLVLLAFLAGIAAWSSIYLSRDTTEADPVQVALETPVDGAVVDAEADLIALPEAEAEAEAEAELPADAVAEQGVDPDATAGPTADALIGPAPDVAATAGAERAQGPTRGPQDEIFLAAIDGQPPAFDAVALPKPQTRPDAAPNAAMPPPPFGTQYEFEADGSIKATATGVVMPDGFWLIAARPPVVPPPRPAAISGSALDPAATTPQAQAGAEAGPAPVAEATATPPPNSAASDAAAASTSGVATMTGPANIADGTTAEGTGPSSAFALDTTVENRRPRGRPAGLVPPAAPDAAPPAEDDAALPDAAPEPDPALVRLASQRPRIRPQSVIAAAAEARNAAQAASLAASAAAAAAEEQAANAPEVLVALSPRPATRPRDFSKAVAAAVSAATRETTRTAKKPAPTAEPEEQDEPEVKVSAAPRIPTRANVAKQATFKNAINLSKTNLIGIYGSNNKRYAMIRTSSGRYKKVRVGDRVDGGTVAAITRNELRYKKGSRMLSLPMPKG